MQLYILVANNDSFKMGDVQLPPGQNWYDMEEVAKHNKESDAWVVVMGNVINVTHFLNLHPGGKPILLEKAGTDATEMFLTIHPPGTLEKHAQDKIIGRRRWSLAGDIDFHAISGWRYYRPALAHRHRTVLLSW